MALALARLAAVQLDEVAALLVARVSAVCTGEKRESEAPETRSLLSRSSGGTPGRAQTPAGGQTDAHGHRHGQSCQPGTRPHSGTLYPRYHNTSSRAKIAPTPSPWGNLCFLLQCSGMGSVPALRHAAFPLICWHLNIQSKEYAQVPPNHRVRHSPAMLLGDVTCRAPAAKAWLLHEERTLHLPAPGEKKHLCIRQKSNYLRSLNMNASRASNSD